MNWLSFSASTLRPARSLLAVSVATLILGACSSGSHATAPTSTPTALTPALFAFYDSNGDGVGDSIARIDLSTNAVMATAVTGVGASSGVTDNQAFYNGPLWMSSGPEVWGIDPTTLTVLPRPVAPSIQGNREGTIGSAMVNALSLTGGTTQTSNTQTTQMAALRQYFGQTSATLAQAETIDFCAVQNSVGGVDPSALTSQSALGVTIPVPPPFYNIGYSAVDIAPTPSGDLTMLGVRLGDNDVFLDTNPNSPTFGYPVRFVYPRLGQIKNQSNAVVGTFSGLYSAAGGTAPGKLFYNRISSGTSEVDKNTYAEPCDSTTARNAAGQVWSWEPDVQGDTLTGTNDDALLTSSPQVVQVAVPTISSASAPASAGGVGSAPTCPNSGGPCSPDGQRTGPWMATLLNHNVGNEFIMSVEDEGDNAQMLWDVTNPAHVFEIERIVSNLQNVLTPSLTTQTGQTTFTNGTIYTVSVSYASTGGATTSVQYQYVSLPGDTFTGVAPADNITHAYLKKVTAADPGPEYILNGLLGRASTSHPDIARIQGSGTNSIMFADEDWLMTFVGADGFQIISLNGLGAPYLITAYLPIPSAFTGIFSPDGTKFYQIRNGDIDVIDHATRTLVSEIVLPGPATAITLGSYEAPITSTTTTTGGGGTTSSSSSSGGSAPPPSPCGG
ncbi:MAG: hypothetical protein ACYDHY_12055 [Acidiferrobacterales bacterium]